MRGTVTTWIPCLGLHAAPALLTTSSTRSTILTRPSRVLIPSCHATHTTHSIHAALACPHATLQTTTSRDEHRTTLHASPSRATSRETVLRSVTTPNTTRHMPDSPHTSPNDRTRHPTLLLRPRVLCVGPPMPKHGPFRITRVRGSPHFVIGQLSLVISCSFVLMSSLHSYHKYFSTVLVFTTISLSFRI